jgi:threonine aldolase
MHKDLIAAFHSDNTVGASPAIAQALMDAAQGTQLPYGADTYHQRVEQQLKDIFETDLSLFLVSTGTAANALGLASITPPWGATLCHPDSHINNDECGAPEFFNPGSKLICIDGKDSKIDPQILSDKAQQKRGDVHSVEPTSVSISQTTESGSLYQVDEIETIGHICADQGLTLQMDGARFANALVSLNCSPAAMTWQAGVKVLALGATKNGALGVDAIVLFDKSLTKEMAFRCKRSGHLMSKMRLLSAQMEAYLTDDLWLHNARHANAMAARLSQGLGQINGIDIVSNSASNILFVRFPEMVIEGLLQQGFGFYHDRWDQGVVRLVTHFNHQPEQIDCLIAAASGLAKKIDTKN